MLPRNRDAMRREAMLLLIVSPTTSPARLARLMGIGWKVAHELLSYFDVRTPLPFSRPPMLGRRGGWLRTCTAAGLKLIRRLRQCAAQS